MKSNLACLPLAAFVFASCDKSETKAKPEDTFSPKPRTENRADAPSIAENPAPAWRDAPDSTAPSNQSPEPVTAEQTIAKYKSGGIPGLPQQVSDKILADAALTESHEDQLNLINQQASAWQHINTFRESDGPIPNHMRMMLLERLTQKHGDSWINMVPELDEQIAASAKVDELRANGIPGLSPDESQNLIIEAMGKYGPDYKAILSVAEQSAKK